MVDNIPLQVLDLKTYLNAKAKLEAFNFKLNQIESFDVVYNLLNYEYRNFVVISIEVLNDTNSHAFLVRGLIIGEKRFWLSKLLKK